MSCGEVIAIEQGHRVRLADAEYRVMSVLAGREGRLKLFRLPAGRSAGLRMFDTHVLKFNRRTTFGIAQGAVDGVVWEWNGEGDLVEL